MLSKQAKKHKANVKDVHFRDFTYIIANFSHCLGVSYTVTIRKHNRGQVGADFKLRFVSDHLNKSNDGIVLRPLLRREKNWLRRIKKRNKKRKCLPHLPPVRRRFDVSSIPQYNCGYERALQLRQHYLQQRQDVTSTANSNAYYQISHHDQSIINAPDVFFRRTPPPDNDSHTTVAATTLLTNLPMTTSRHQIPQHYFRIKG
ncbi:unnamed protein product [Rhizophagus irregularis]|nr:unnamed protein product [Rhizophagus irregularis]